MRITKLLHSAVAILLLALPALASAQSPMQSPVQPPVQPAVNGSTPIEVPKSPSDSAVPAASPVVEGAMLEDAPVPFAPYGQPCDGQPCGDLMSPEAELFYRENAYRTPYGYNEWFPEFKMFRPGFTGPYAIEHPIIPRLIKIPGRDHLILIESPEYFRAEHARYGNGFQPRYYGVRGNFDVRGGW